MRKKVVHLRHAMSTSANATREDAPETPIARLIDERGLRKGWVAEKLGISPSSLSRLIWGERRMTLDEGLKLAEILGVDVRELLVDGGAA